MILPESRSLAWIEETAKNNNAKDITLVEKTKDLMYFKHTNRPGFWLGFIDFFTAGLFFLLYMPLGGLQNELDYILERRTQRYWVAYLLGIPTAFIYPLVWMTRIAEELKAKAIEMDIEGPYTSWWHMFGWNTFGLLLMGPAVATWRFFDTLNKIEARMNEDSRT